MLAVPLGANLTPDLPMRRCGEQDRVVKDDKGLAKPTPWEAKIPRLASPANR